MNEVVERQETEVVQPEMGTPAFMTMCIEAREKEIMGYMFNVDNYVMAIADIKADAGLMERQGEFLQQIEGLLASERKEMERAEIMLRVLNKRA